MTLAGPRAIARAALLLVAALALACSEKTPTLPRLAATDVIVAFGDSLTFGTGAAEQESYPAVLAELTGRTVIRAGVPGEVTAQALGRLPRVLEEHRPQLVIVCIGGNDFLRRLSATDTKANLRAMLALLKAQGVAVVLVGVPQPAIFADPPAMYAELARELKIPYESAVVKNVLFNATLRSDPIHPNAQGYRRMAEAIAALMKKSGAI